MSSNDTAVILKDISKCFHVYANPRDRLKQMVKKKIYHFMGNELEDSSNQFWALKNISLEIKKGETVGIIGRNGAGKSTLLQLICGTMAPTTGSLTVNGRMAALLELGAGFNPEFTGRENVFLYGSVLGLGHKEIQSRFSEIENFADIGQFIEQPVKTYSSGMFVRLAFAVAICVEPDILIVDEALAVGDVKFQAKCFRHFKNLVSSGKTIIFVTHSTEQIVRHCSWAFLLENGEIIKNGEPKQVENLYLNMLFGSTLSDANGDHQLDSESGGPEKKINADVDLAKIELMPLEEAWNYNPGEYRWGNREAEIIGFLMTCRGENVNGSIQFGHPFEVFLRVKFHISVHLPIFGLTIKTPDGIVIFGTNSRDFIGGPCFRPCKENDIVTIQFTVDQRLGQGDYFLSFGVVEQNNENVVPLDRRYDAVHIHISSDRATFGLVDMYTDIRIS